MAVAATTAIGCAPEFQFAHPLSAVTSTSSSSSSPGAPSGQLKSTSGSLTWNSTTTTTGTQLTYELTVPYGRVYQPLALVVSAMLPYSCQWLEGVESSAPGNYNPGEIPCGSIENSSTKQLLSVPLANYQTGYDGFNVTVAGLTVPVLMSRTQNQGTYTEASLDSKSTVAMTSSQNFGDDISVKYTPGGNTTDIDVCVNVPGAAITTTHQTVSANAVRSILGIKLGFGSTFSVDPGQASFDYGRGCITTNFGWTASAAAPTVALTASVAPYLDNLTYSGLNIGINNWFLRMVDNIMGFFHDSLRAQVISRLTTTVNNYADSDFETGKWFSQIQGQAMLNAAGTRMNQAMSTALTRLGIPSSAQSLNQLLLDECHLMQLTADPNWDATLETFCTDALDQVQITVQPFAVDSASKAAGCYDYYARIIDTNQGSSSQPWWANQCQFASQFSMTLPSSVAQYQPQLQALFAHYISPNRIPAAWQQVLHDQGVNALVFTEALTPLVKKSQGSLTATQLRSILPSVASEITSQLAK